jgi:hypothetical protein
LGHLEPAGGPGGGGLSIIDLSHVDDGRAVVSAAESDRSTTLRSGLLVQLHVELIASLNTKDQRPCPRVSQRTRDGSPWHRKRSQPGCFR